MYALYDLDRMLDQLLGDRRCNACKHEKGGLGCIVRLDDMVSVILINSRSQHWILISSTPIGIVSRDEIVIALSLDIFKCCKEGPVSDRVLHER